MTYWRGEIWRTITMPTPPAPTCVAGWAELLTPARLTSGLWTSPGRSRSGDFWKNASTICPTRPPRKKIASVVDLPPRLSTSWCNNQRRQKETLMRFMVIVKASKDSEAGIMPSEQLLADMGKFNEELARA